MRCRNVLVVAILASLGSASDWVVAAEPDRKPDEQAIRATAKQYVAALERGDAKVLAAFWTPDGTFIDEQGKSHPASELIAQEAKPAPSQTSRPKVTLTGSAIRFLTPDVAVEDGTSEVSYPDVKGQAPVRGRFSVTWVKQQGKWRLASLTEMRSEPASTAAQMKDLDWMAGEWSAKDAELEISARWNPNHTFLVRELKVSKDGQLKFTGTQRIGFDPATNRIKSWMFDSEGGQGEGTWSKQGNTWIVQAKGTLPDGKPTSSTTEYIYDGKNSFTWKSTGPAPSGGGQVVPHLDLTIVRKVAAEPGSDAAAKAKILASPQWRRAMFELDEWLSAQPLYDAKQVQEIKANLDKQVKTMSSKDLELMLADLSTKFAIMDSKEALEARAWAGQYLSTLATKKRDEVLKNAPNLLTMTAAQLNQELVKIEQKRKYEQQAAALAQNQPVPTDPFSGKSNAAALAAYRSDHAPTAGAASSSPYRQPTSVPFEHAQIGPQMTYNSGFGGGVSFSLSSSSW